MDRGLKSIATDSQSGRRSSMTQLNTTESFDQKATPTQKPRMATLQTLEAKMANIEESLSLSVAARRRKGTSLGSVSSRSSPKLDTILSNGNNNMNSSATHPKDNHQDREIIMQNLRVQLGLDKQTSGRSSSASVSGPPAESGEKPGNEQRLSRLRNDAENKRNAIRNLKGALQKLDMNPTLDIDSRIRQAELEYALGREELQLLSIIEDARAIQARLEKEKLKSDVTSIFSLMRNGHQLTLHSVQASTGRWNANQKNDGGDGFYVDWVMDGEELQRGDRIIEVNGRVLSGRSKDELQKICLNTSKCDFVVIRKRSVSMVSVMPPAIHHHNQHQLQQTQADNMRLQHRISYLEEQVKELLEVQKEKLSPVMSTGSQRSGTHITSISISSSPSDHDDDRPVTYQRGSFVTTIVGGKPQNPPPKITATTTSSAISKSSSTTNINGHYHVREAPRESEKPTTPKSVKSLSSSMSKISISTDLHVQKQRREREKKERERYYNNKNATKTSQQLMTKNSITASMNHIENSYMKRNRHAASANGSTRGHDDRSIKSLDFESDNGHTTNYDDYASEPVPAPKIRPTPPKKPLRLSLQRARSLQTVNGNESHHNGLSTPLMDTMNISANDKKRAIKRIYRGELGSKHSRSIDLSPKYIEKYV